MFWSLILEPGKRYSSTVKETFHLSMAALDVKNINKDNEIFPVRIEINGQDLLLCNLSKPQNLQVSLDLMFQKGSDITFFTSGKATIHLTGYVIQDDLSDAEDISDLGSSDEDGMLQAPSSGEEDEAFENLRKKKNAEKAKAKAQQKEANTKLATPSKRKLESGDEVSKKKPKAAKNAKDEDDDDSDEDSSGDLDENELGKLVDSLNENDADSESDEEDSDEDDDEEGEDEDSEGEDDLDSDLDDEDLDDSSDDESEEQTNKKPQTPVQNKQNKTPVSNKKQEKLQAKSQLTNGATPVSAKKDKKNQANQTTPKQDNQKTPKKGKEEVSTPQSQKKQTLAGGIIVEELKQGNGPVAKSGKMIGVYYTGRFKNNNRVFDQSNQGPGFKFRLGNGEVIKGWDVGLSGMKVGSKRRITVPPGMAYGNKGSPPQIPPNSWLVFDVELKSVN